ncbi:hypothetical protein BN1723_007239 [Verticillium longisporum]|uniref:Phosphotransferase n=1 Tax=Verticillium longisporum TaxID=100787 RepID=A0A0G4LJ23_VERLO|nr:hypothetical protein BN1708_013275 [Verticillium longisporum]CRK46779.1 hypothetical protein BN1723_007239 [Verticillium longisporum]
MQPLVSAMTTIHRSFLAAIVKQLLRGKSLIQSLLTFWTTSSHRPSSAKKSSTSSSSSSQSIYEGGKVSAPYAPGLRRSTQDFLREVEELVLRPLLDDGLLELSHALKAQFRTRLQTDPACMLPSFNHKLPTGLERGRYLALDVGGSTLRVALVELRGHDYEIKGMETEIVSMKSFRIDKTIKDLEGVAFFDWMADRIVETLENEEEGRRAEQDGALPMALSWSFPIEQTSLRSGRIHGMGKGFRAADGLQGQDLGTVIEAACRRSGLVAELLVILNDGNATLLSRAYTHPATRFGLILGTGVNIAAHLPVPLIGAAKFGERPQEWFEAAQSVIVNAELGMFGHDILSITRWDADLKAGHPRPDFQPLEHMLSGMYLGEVARFVLIEAITTTGVFGGVVPENLTEPYSLSTETMSMTESDNATLETAIAAFAARHPSSHAPTATDLAFFRDISALICRRSAAILAAAVHGIWDLRLDGVRETLPTLSPSEAATAETELALKHTMVAFNGSVLESYPGYRDMCQSFVNELLEASGKSGLSIDLVPAKESSIIGAGVALAAVV